MNWRAFITLVTHASVDPVPPESLDDGAVHERLAIPFQFHPQLSVSDAAAFALRALVRIFLGSLLFGVWGAYSLLVWTSVHNPYLRGAAMIPMFAVFLALLAGMMIATSWRRHPRR